MEYDSCPLCHVKHDIVHLLFSCVKAKEIWKHVGMIFDMNITLYNIVGVSNISPNFDWFLSFLSYCIYKEWLCHYTDLDIWCNVNVLSYVKSCVEIQKGIYRNLDNDFADIVKCFERFTLMAK